jgi:hypothetical protein
MKSSQTSLTNVLGTIGIGYGLFLGITKNKSFGVTTLYVIGFGIAGLFIGSKLGNNIKIKK